ncbi:hypothetical protein [Mycolicibacter kumamotonensis]|uniref:Uncharacterized protein n=1 Tax=Mycolicibacter kumamotonensis TaxID=354243 RepID=A0A1B8SL75_9MYCO|nr:hypothetical protein [Mycolicibacter kumamotonensis]OBY33454.1 hypothetical protein ACT18_00440 [Mycolicibacter kumamotonensis]
MSARNQIDQAAADNGWQTHAGRTTTDYSRDGQTVTVEYSRPGGILWCARGNERYSLADTGKCDIVLDWLRASGEETA